MANAVDAALIRTYSSNIMLMVQQMSNILAPTVFEKPDCSGEMAFQPQLASSEAKEKTSRNQNVENEDPQYNQRKIVPRYFYKAPLIDKLDKLMLVKDPTSEIVQNNAAALARAKDTVIATQMFATAYSGVDGTTTNAFKTANIVALSSSSLTLTKLRSAIALLNAASVPAEDRHCAHSSVELTALLGDSTLTSADYNTVKALVDGQVDHFLGLKFHMTEKMPVTASLRKCAVYHRTAICLGIWIDLLTSIDILPGKHFSAQVYAGQSYGAVRLEEEKIVEVDCSLT